MDGKNAVTRAPETAELFDLIHALGDALETHYDWLWQVQKTVVCGSQQEHVDATCHLAHWLEAAEHLFDGDERLIVTHLHERHDAMHAAAEALLRGAADRSTGLEVYDAFLTERKLFKLSARRLEQALWSATCLIDSLTGLRNRHGMFPELKEQQHRSLREGRSCSLAMMDLDHFKAINDGHGHIAGDAILRSVSRLAMARLRPYDRIYRYGGEEFLICLPDTTLELAGTIIERLREEIAMGPVTVGEAAVQVTVSFGLAVVDAALPVEESIRRADRALYAAKQAGRNRVVCAPAV